jgi:uncharacterized UBP type Zn finger protein
MSAVCHHFDQATVFETGTRVCAECVELGSGWVHLRLCLVCGHVGCCDSSPNKHASAHYRDTRDPVMRSLEPGEGWGYCFEDDLFVEEVPSK